MMAENRIIFTPLKTKRESAELSSQKRHSQVIDMAQTAHG